MTRALTVAEIERMLARNLPDRGEYGGGHARSGWGDRRRAAPSLNDADRAQWIDNDEGLYSWWKSSRQSKRDFIRENRDELTAAINRALGRA